MSNLYYPPGSSNNNSGSNNNNNGPPRPQQVQPYPFQGGGTGTGTGGSNTTNAAPSSLSSTNVNANIPTSNLRHSSGSASAQPTAAQPARHFTPSMRDRQARGKDPYSVGEVSDSEMDFEGFDPRHEDFIGGMAGSGRHGASRGGTGGAPGGGSFETWRRKEWARDVLASPEMLMWYASSREDSIPGTRLYFTSILLGFEDDMALAENTPRKGGAGMAGGSARSQGHKRH